VVDRRPAEPAFLDRIFGFGCGTQHLIRDREQQVAVLGKRPLGNAHCGRRHRSEKPWLVSPRALLKRDRSFSIAIIFVSSTTAGTPSAAVSSATISSVTAGGDTVMASA